MDYPYQYAALHFDGSQTATGEAAIGFKLDGSVPFTVDAFVRMTEKLTDKEILSQTGSFSLGISGNRLYFRMEGFPEIIASEEVPVLTGDWAHVCVVYGRPATVLYVNGIEAASANLTGTGSISRKPFVFFRNTVGELRQVRFFDSALTADQVRHYMLNTEVASLASLAAYFDFSRIPAEELVRGLPVEAETASMYRLCSKGALFLGHTFASIDKEARINPGGKHNDPYTVQAWVYFQDSEEGEKQTVFSNGDVTADAGMSLYIERLNGEYKVKGLRGTTGADSILTSKASLKPEQWVNLALTYDIDTMEIYIDGVLDSRLSRLFPIEVELEDPCLHIGAEVVDNGLNGRNWLKGCISRLDIWERRLDANEIAAYARSAPQPDAAGLQATYAFHIAGNNNSCTGVLLGEHNRFSYGEVSYPYSGQEAQVFREVSMPLPGDEDSEPLSAEMLAAFRREAYEKHRDGLSGALLAELMEKQGIQADPERFRFNVTTHRMDGKVYFVAHTAEKSYTVYYDEEDFEAAEDQWYLELILILVLGLIDIVIGISAKANKTLISKLTTLIKSSTFRTMFSGDISVSTLINFFIFLYRQNQLRDILDAALAGLTWWKVALMIAKTVALTISWAYGLTEVYYAVALGALVIEVVIHITEKPKRPSSIALAAVKFHHSDASYTLDKLRLDKESYVPVPEWTSQRTDCSYTAYIMDKISGDIIVKASFETNRPLTATVKCIDKSEGRLLGDSNEVVVVAPGGRTPYYDFVFSQHQLTSGGVQSIDIELSWEGVIVTDGQGTNLAGGSGEGDLLETTHRFYTLASTPNPPWGDVTPSVAVYDYAISWSPGCTTAPQIAEAITDSVYWSLGLVYDVDGGGGPSFTYSKGERKEIVGYFKLNEFINYLKNKKPEDKQLVNCSDCAAIVSTFANALGCNLSQKVMQGIKDNFKINPVILIGYDDWSIPFEEGFGYHQVCMMEPNDNHFKNLKPIQNNYHVFDACLQLDITILPGINEANTADLSEGMRFSLHNDDADYLKRKVYYDDSYREHLAVMDDGGVNNCFYFHEYNVIQAAIYRKLI